MTDTSDFVVTVVTDITIPECRSFFTHQGPTHEERGRSSYFGRPTTDATWDYLGQFRQIVWVERAFIDMRPRSNTSVWINHLGSWDDLIPVKRVPATETVNTAILRLIFTDLGIEYDPERVNYVRGTTDELLADGWTYISVPPDGNYGNLCGTY